MNASYRWLRAMVPGLEDTPQQVADRLARSGAPVDEMVRLAEGLEGIRIARVVETAPHPNADRLRVCRVDAGTGEVLDVVCGAPNVEPGGVYPFAPVGATIPGGITIRKAKIRGEVSEGMLCSAKELGLGRDHAGLMALHGDFEPGQDFVDALGLDDVRLVVDVTANRPDLLSHIGLARELADERGVRLPEIPGGDAAAAAALPVERGRFDGRVAGVTVRIEDAESCPRYIGAVIRGVRVAPSPEWLATRLRAIGLRPINNVVDATNYVLHELGQPLHAFDLGRMAGPEVVVRRALNREPVVTLDGVARELSEEMLVIADAARPVAVAGVMGGEDPEVVGETTDVFLECALFDTTRTRSTRRALGISTDASYRFERGVDPEGTERAARRAIELILAAAGGTVDGGLLDLNPEPLEPLVVDLRPARVERVLGRRFEVEELTSLLRPLGFERVEGAEPGGVRFRVPGARRYDVYREIDLIEEVARRFGYDALEAAMPAFRPTTVPDDPVARLEARLREILVGRGLLEARSAAFAPEAEGQIGLLNPLSKAETHLRSAILPGLVHRVEYNFSQGVRHIRLFEIGTVFTPATAPATPPVERTRLAVVFTGGRTPPHWSAEPEPFDVWDLKGLMADVVRTLGLDAAALQPVGDDRSHWLAAGVGFRIVVGAETIGMGGQIARGRVDAPAWAGAVWGFEVDLLPSMAEVRHRIYTALPAYPAVERDLALLLPAGLEAERVEALIRTAGGSLLEAVWPFDLYVGQGVPAGMRSVAFRARFRAPDRTLTDPEVDAAVDRILRRLLDELDVQRRA